MEGIKPYMPLSKGFSLQVSIPSSMAYETGRALIDIERRYGDIDQFVADRLKYESVKQMHGYLAAEQVDGVALAIDNIEKGQGVIIGDQTGIGKGRQAAAILRYAIVNGFHAVFVTEKSTLFSDIYRDLSDIGSDDFVPFIFNADKEAEVKNTKGEFYHKFQNPLFKVRPSAETESICQAQLEAGSSVLPEGYDFMMLTYSQTSGDNISAQAKLDDAGIRKELVEKGSQGKTKLLREYAKDAIFILDEAHNAGGSNSTTGYYFRELLAKSKGCAYLSATFAKRPDNMPLYAIKTSISDAGLGGETLISAFESGGLALQEAVAAELVKGGQMVRRQRTFEGIEVVWKYMDDLKEEHWEMVDKVTSIMRRITDFQRDYVKPFIAGVDEQMFGDMQAEENRGKKNFGVDNSDYFSKAHNVIFQLMFALKAEAAAHRVVEHLNEGRKVVVAFSSTMGSFLDQLGHTEGDTVERTDFALVLQKGLESTLEYVVRDPREKAPSDKIIISPSDLFGGGEAVYDEIMDDIQKASTGLSLSPIDTLIHVIEAAKRPNDKIGGVPSPNYRVRECTGRNGRIDFSGKKPIYRRFKSDKNKFFREFNNGSADVLLINQSAATGVSAHSSEKFKDQRQRVMLIHQPELDVNKEVQKRGRINRTGQVNLPKYEYLVSTIPSEQRQFMILKAKLKSLDANTTGNQENNKSQLDIRDFFNKYGGEVIFKYLKHPSNRDLNDQMGNPCYRKAKDRDGNEYEERIPNADIPRRVTNRVQLLPVALQEEFYRSVGEDYNEYVADLKEKGLYDLEVEYVDLQAEVKKRYLYVQGSGKPSVFGADSVVEECITKVQTRPFKMVLVEEKLAEELKGKSPEKYMEFLRQKMDNEHEAVHAQILAAAKKKWEERKLMTAKAKTSLEAVPEIGKDEKETEKFNDQREKRAKRLEQVKAIELRHEEEYKTREAQLKSNIHNLGEFLDHMPIGAVVAIPYTLHGSSYTYYGVVIRWEFNWKLTNPFDPAKVRVIIAENSDRVKTTLKLHVGESYKALLATKNLDGHTRKYVKERWDSSQNNNANDLSFIVTGNILKAIGRSGGSKLMKYTLKNGAMATGILLQQFAENKELEINKFRESDPSLRPSISLNSLLGKLIETGKGEVQLQGDELRIRREYGDFMLIVAPRGRKKILTDLDLLKLAKRTQQEIEDEQSFGNFRTYTGNLQFAYFEEKNLMAVLDLLDSKHGVRVTADKPVLMDFTDEEKDYKQRQADMQKLLSMIEKGFAGIEPIQLNDPMEKYHVAKISPSKYPAIAALKIEKQSEIESEFGEQLLLTKAIYLVKEASHNFQNPDPLAQQLDGMIMAILKKKGFQLVDMVQPEFAVGEQLYISNKNEGELHGEIVEIMASEEDVKMPKYKVKVIDSGKVILVAEAELSKVMPALRLGPPITDIMPKHQLGLVKKYETGDRNEIIKSIRGMLDGLPKLRGQDGKGRQAMVHLHYFYGDSDWFITEWDKGGDMFGYAILNSDYEMSELGYISPIELVGNGKVELDFWWKPTTLQKALEKVDKDYFGEKKSEPQKKGKPKILNPEPYLKSGTTIYLTKKKKDFPVGTSGQLQTNIFEEDGTAFLLLEKEGSPVSLVLNKGEYSTEKPSNQPKAKKASSSVPDKGNSKLQRRIRIFNLALKSAEGEKEKKVLERRIRIFKLALSA